MVLERGNSMLEVSREEFEEKIQDLIDGKTTRKKLIKELETDSRTLNNKIREMSKNLCSQFR